MDRSIIFFLVVTGLIILVFIFLNLTSPGSSSSGFNVSSYRWHGPSYIIPNPPDDTINWYIIRVYTYYFGHGGGDTLEQQSYVAQHSLTVRNSSGTISMLGIVSTDIDQNPEITPDPSVLSDVDVSSDTISITSSGGTNWYAIVERFSEHI